MRAVLVDCRFDVMDPAHGRELYLEGHAPGREDQLRAALPS